MFHRSGHNTFRFSKYRGSLCFIQWTEIQIYRVHVIEERCHIKFMTLIKILKPDARWQSWEILFFHHSGQTNPSGKGGKDEFFIGKSDQEDLYSCHFKDLVVKIAYFWSYDTCNKVVSRNSILIFFYSIMVDKNTLRAMSLGSMTSTVFVWSNTADNDCRFSFSFIGHYCQLASRNA